MYRKCCAGVAVEIKCTVYLGIGREGGVELGYVEEVEGEECLEFIPELHEKV